VAGQCVTHQNAIDPARATTARALLATPHLFKAPQMSPPDNGNGHPLPEELDRALRRATDRTLVALTSLRKAVRQHVHDERERGTTLPQIELELRGIIARVLKDAEGRDSVDGERDTLAHQMLNWSKGFYGQQD
jgi:hypothetical protein